MIKSLFDADDEEKRVEPMASTEISTETSTDETPFVEPRPTFELPGDSRFFKKSAGFASEGASGTPGESASAADESTPELPEPKYLVIEPEKAPVAAVADEQAFLSADAFANAEAEVEPATETSASPETPVVNDLYDSPSGTLFKQETPVQPIGETIRQSGLAYSAAMVLFGAVVFMMLLGWFADLLIDSSPWGIVGGIILGAIVGFVQFFRITSQIFKK